MKKYSVILLLFLVMILSSFLTNANPDSNLTSVTITAPLSGSSNGGTVTFSATYVGNLTETDNRNNITFNIENSTSSVHACADITLATLSGTASCTFDTASITMNDITSYIVNASAFNTTHTRVVMIDGANDTQDTVTFDNVLPDSLNLTAIPPQFIELFDILNYQCVGSDRVDTSLTFAVQVNKPSGNSGNSTTATGTFRGSDFDQPGIYTLRCTVTDNVGNSNTTSFSLYSDEEGNEALAVQVLAKEKEGNNLLLFVFLAGGLVILMGVVIAGVYFVRKK